MPLPSAEPSVTLWQFLLELLKERKYQHLICWTNGKGEFKLVDAEGVARLWGSRKNKPHMNYEKMSRALRYYYGKNIIKKVSGQKFVYRFTECSKEESNLSCSSGDSLFATDSAEHHNVYTQLHPYFPEPSFPYGNVDRLYLMNLDGSKGKVVEATPSPRDSVCSPNSMKSSDGAGSSEAVLGNVPEVACRKRSVKFGLPSTSKAYDTNVANTRSTFKSEAGTEMRQDPEKVAHAGSRKRHTSRNKCSRANAGSEAPGCGRMVPKKEEVDTPGKEEVQVSSTGTPGPKRKKPEPLNLSGTQSSVRFPSLGFGLGANPLLAASPLLSPFGILAASMSANFFSGSPQAPLLTPTGRYSLLGPFNNSLSTPLGSPSLYAPVFQFPPSSQHASLMAQQMAVAAMSPTGSFANSAPINAGKNAKY